MRGKYINTNIMMAALAGKRWRRLNGTNATHKAKAVNEVKETPASVADYQIIWRKPAKAVERKPLYRCITACIY